MDINTKLFSEIESFIKLNAHLINCNQDSINIKIFEAREVLLTKLTQLNTTISKLGERIAAITEQTVNNHEAEKTTMSVLLTKKKNEQPWTTVSKRRPCPPQLTNAFESKQPSKVKFTEALSLPAICVPTFDYVKQDGELYYVDSADHFAFKISGRLFHGNIGSIYTEEKNPENIKNCKFATGCMKQEKCDYYHDPLDFPGSKDHRNFIASSWLYAPPNSQFKNGQRSRRFGSREHLDVDIVGLQAEEITRFHDQTMHDVLCSLLISEAHRRA